MRIIVKWLGFLGKLGVCWAREHWVFLRILSASVKRSVALAPFADRRFRRGSRDGKVPDKSGQAGKQVAPRTKDYPAS